MRIPISLLATAFSAILPTPLLAKAHLPIAEASVDDYALVGLAPATKGQAIVETLFDPNAEQLTCKAEAVRGGNALGHASCKLVLMKMGWVPGLKQADGKPLQIPKMLIRWTPDEQRPKSPDGFREERDGTTPIDPAAWVTDQDYPPTSVQGRSELRIAVNERGLPADCQITKSAGSALLDNKGCELIASRARFMPALGPDGTPRAATFKSRIIWRKPR